VTTVGPRAAEPVTALSDPGDDRHPLRATLRELGLGEIDRDVATRRLEQLARITAGIAAAVSSHEVFRALVDEAGAVLGASSAALWVVRDDAPVRLVRCFGYPEGTQEAFEGMPLDQAPISPAFDCIRRGDPIWIGSQEELLAAYPGLAEAVTPGRHYRIACLPIFAGGRSIGALGFTFDGGGAFDEHERRFLLLLARYSSQALERLHLLEAEQHSRMGAELLYRLARAVIRAVDLEQVFTAALDAIESALGANRSAILAFDAEGVMRFKAWRGLSEDYRRAVEGHSPWARDARDPQPVIVGDALGDDALAAYGPLFRSEGIGALGFIPLVADRRLIGKFMVYYRSPQQILPDDLKLAVAIADHVAAAMSRFHAVAVLEETVRFNEMFTGILGHDLRNPLGAIMTAAQLLEMRADNERITRPTARILRSGGRMKRMIDQLLDFTRVRVGNGIPLSRAAVDLMPLLSQVVDELDEANPNWLFQIDHRGDTHGTWDGDRLSQVFSNLIANAIQHGHPGGGVSVTVDGSAPNAVRLEVRNQGAIAPELLPRLFEPMAGRQHPTDRARGLGLGLYITREIVRAHGGQITANAAGPDETIVAVTLPRSPSTG
jgi:signal transduction histidine kinase